MSEFLTHSIKSAAFTDIFGNKMFFDRVDNFRISFDPDDTNEITFEGTCMRIEGSNKDSMEGLAKKEEEVLEIPKAEIAYEKTKTARKEKALKEIDEEWKYLTNLIYDGIKNGDFSVTVQTLCDENVERLKDLGYIIFKQDNTYGRQTRISWF